ncbi:MAG: SPFH domain-containing protein, partial [Clostridia bacterium]|nr:SPFH domain-containing protein [Clostridia bacterium]
ELQKSAVYTNVNMAAASRVSAQNDAMRAAAANEGAGPFMAFAGMNLAQNAGGDVSGLYAMGQQQPIPPVGQQAAPAAAGWTCPECGATGNTGKFCTNCGKPKPEEGWTCPECGAKGNTGKFCTNCGKPKPDGKWHCPNCGSENTGKFCTNCGNPRP